jgi:hypothetical protein
MTILDDVLQRQIQRAMEALEHQMVASLSPNRLSQVSVVETPNEASCTSGTIQLVESKQAVQCLERLQCS